MQHPPCPTELHFLWGNANERDTWNFIARRAIGFVSAHSTHDGTASLREILALIGEHPKTKNRRFWKEAVHQAIERSDEFVRIEKGRWGFSAGRSEEELARLRELRVKECPKRPRNST